MEQMTAEKIACAVGGQILCGDPSTPVLDICTDSRQCKPGDLYVPILGERVDGHRFIEGAFRAGAAAVFTSKHRDRKDIDREEKGQTSEGVWIAVDDTRAALQALGRYCRNLLSIPFVGVTGSVGKTSTRAMIATALSAGFRTFQTAGNANSQVGVPITLSRVTGDSEAAVIELGMSEPGEMTRIASIAGLNVAVMTNIGISHIEQLGSQAGILREKLHITDGLRPDGVLVLNGDDPYLCPEHHEKTERVEELADCVARYRTVYYGTEPHNDYRAEEIRVEGGRTVFELNYPDIRTKKTVRLTVTLPVIGTHHVMNALAALACADLLGVPVEAAAAALSGFTGVAHRQETLLFPSLGITVIDDSYNASPDSMRAAITALSMTACEGRRIAVLADMWELGEGSPGYHYEVGEAVGRSPVDVLITVGERALEIARGAQDIRPDLPVVSFADRFGAGDWLETNRRAGDLILLKGSNGMKLFEIAQEWKQSV